MLTSQVGAEAPSLPWGHAHNDYHHPRPLADALDHGFGSVEADIFWQNEQLLVGHASFELRPERTLQALYLDPLRERVQANQGRVHPDAENFILLIDIKSDGEATYEALRSVLAEYRDILSHCEEGRFVVGPVTAILSGARPIATVTADANRCVGLDGRLADLDSSVGSDLMPLISDNWGSHFGWRGEGEMPRDERERLREIVRRTHAAGRKLRFWATPDKPAVWKELRAAQVDLIGVDNLGALREFQQSE